MTDRVTITKAEENAVIALLKVCFVIVIFFVVAAVADINPLEEYGWFSGCSHGLLAIPNWVMSWFSDTVIIKAPLCTSAYIVSWWIGLIFAIINSLVFLIKIIASILILNVK